MQRYRYSPEHQIVEARVIRYRDRPGEGKEQPAATEQVTRYRYDALGRRIDKHDAFGRTSFLYDGDLLAGELRGSKLSEYLYEPDSFVPLAKLESEWKGEKTRDSEPKPLHVAETAGEFATEDVAEQKPKDFTTYYYHCDQIGAPQELTDEAGRIAWAASHKVWEETQVLHGRCDGLHAGRTANRARCTGRRRGPPSRLPGATPRRKAGPCAPESASMPRERSTMRWAARRFCKP
ncbi:hypothetical protein ACAN107058_04480 [Paracidovorax anthurii]